jgi:hypothetical protein
MKRNTHNNKNNKNSIHNINSNYFKSQNNSNFQFSMMNNKNSSSCNSCPNNIKDIKIENIDTKILENELIKAEKKIQSISKNKEVQKPCKNCGLHNNIGFRIKNNGDDHFMMICNPTYYLNFTEDYYFEEITILNKDGNYIAINENMISNNSKKKLTINFTKDFYDNLRMPLVFNCKCILANKEYLYVNGFII